MPKSVTSKEKRKQGEQREPRQASIAWLPLVLITGLVLGSVTVIGYVSQSPPPAAPPPTIPVAQPTQTASPGKTAGPPARGAPPPTSTPLPAPSGFKASYTGGPRLTVEKPDLDLGAYTYTDNAIAAWTLRNVGDAPLTVQLPEMAKVVEGC